MTMPPPPHRVEGVVRQSGHERINTALHILQLAADSVQTAAHRCQGDVAGDGGLQDRRRESKKRAEVEMGATPRRRWRQQGWENAAWPSGQSLGHLKLR